METRELSYVSAINRMGNISDAAHELFISQTALYKSLRKIEDELGETLFYKDRGRMVPTEVGKIVIDTADDVQEKLSKMDAKIKDAANLKYGKVTIGFPSIVALMFFPNLLLSFKNMYPDINIVTAEDGGENLISRTVSGELDMAITMAPVNSKVLNEILITDDIVAAGVNKDHLWVNKEYITLEDLSGTRFLTFDHTFRMHQQLVNRFREAQLKPDFSYTSLSCQFLVEMARKSNEILVLPRPIIDFYSEGNMVTIPIEPAFPWRLALIYRKDIYMSKASRAMVAFIDSYFQDSKKLL